MRLLLIIVLSSLLIAPSMEVFGSSHGIEGYSETGCNCHGSNPGDDTYVEIIGIPKNYSHGEVYQLTITLTGGPQEAEQGHRGIQPESLRRRLYFQRFDNIHHRKR